MMQNQWFCGGDNLCPKHNYAALWKWGGRE